MDDFLDPDYIHLTQENVNLFNEKHKLIHSVFSTTLQNDRGMKCLENMKTILKLKHSAKICVDFMRRL